MKYLIQFINASNPIVFIPFFIFVYLKVCNNRLNLSYFNYTIVMPIWFGLLNIFSLYIKSKFNISHELRYILISVISLLILIFILNNGNFYNYNKNEWVQHYIGITLSYLVIWNIIIFNIENLTFIKKKLTSWNYIIMLTIFGLYILYVSYIFVRDRFNIKKKKKHISMPMSETIHI